MVIESLIDANHGVRDPTAIEPETIRNRPGLRLPEKNPRAIREPEIVDHRVFDSRCDPLLDLRRSTTRRYRQINHLVPLTGRHVRAPELHKGAVRWAERSLALAPRSPIVGSWKALSLFAVEGDPLAAEMVQRDASNSSDTDVSFRVVWLQLAGKHQSALELALAETRAAAGREDEAREGYAKALEILSEELAKRPDDETVHAALGLAHGGLGHREEAIRHGRRAVELMPFSKDAMSGPWYLYFLARVYSRVGSSAAACDTIDDILSIPAPITIRWFEQHPGFAPIREAECFRELRQERSSAAPAAESSRAS